MKSTEKSQKLFDAITDIREDVITEASDHTFKHHRRSLPRWAAPIAAALCLSFIVSIFLWPTPLATAAYALVEAQYPDMAPYPIETSFYDEGGNFDSEAYQTSYSSWEEDQTLQDRPAGYAEGIEAFIYSSSHEFLSDTANENRVFSPLNTYMALGILAEISTGKSRQQILNALGSSSIDALRRQASDIWNASYNDDGFYTSILSTSIWMDEDLPVHQDTLQLLADTYYTSSYSGPMGSRKFDKAYRSWMNEHTGHLLEDSVSDLGFTRESVLSIATAISYKAAWANPFAESKTASATFHAPSGDMTCDFMNQSSVRDYYWGENFTAIAQPEAAGGKMLFILPDEGVSFDKLLADSKTMDFILADMSGQTWENTASYQVNFSVPKFDVSSDIDLSDGLRQLGINHIFSSPDLSDAASSIPDLAPNFSPLTTITGLGLSQLTHTARVSINEVGYEAASYTDLAVTSDAPEVDCDEIDFTLDRPFLFVTLSPDGLPMFIGVVNSPL